MCLVKNFLRGLRDTIAALEERKLLPWLAERLNSPVNFS